jgi:hypothetical protein
MAAMSATPPTTEPAIIGVVLIALLPEGDPVADGLPFEVEVEVGGYPVTETDDQVQLLVFNTYILLSLVALGPHPP